MTDANGNRAEMTWDGFDRQKRWIFPSNTPGDANAADYEEYGYDPVGNRTTLRKRDGSELTYQYDNLNRVIRKTVPERAGLTAAQTRDVYYDYNHALGLQTKARFDNLDGYGVTHYYDAFGQPTTVLLNMDGNARYTSYSHDEAGNLFRLTHPDDAAFAYSYDALGRMTQVNEHRAAPSIDDLIVRYWYNAAGSRHSAVRGAGSGGFYTIWYRDPLERPSIVASDLPAAGDDMVIELAYNPASQIVSRSLSNDSYAAPTPDNTNRGYQVNGLNQYTGTTWGGAPNWSFEYDPNGNLKRSIDPAGAGTTSFVYDVENRLVSASGKANATLVYDPLGRLVQITNAAGVQTHFLYDGDRMIAEYDGSGTLTKRYVHGPVADEPVAVYYGPDLGLANRRYTMADERGSIMALVAADGTPAVKNRYDPWGVPAMGPLGPVNEGRFQYTGQAWIGELGLYYYKARFYSPFLGRFMQTDPIGYEGGVNLYGYVENDPINGRDPTGLADDCNTGSRTGSGFASGCRHAEGGQGHHERSNRQTQPQVQTQPAPTPPQATRSVIAAAARCPLCTLGAVVAATLTTATSIFVATDLQTTVVNRPSIFLPRSPNREITVYRLYGGAAGPLGRSWTTMDPRTMRDPRDSLGLPNSNTATNLMIGRLAIQPGIVTRPALPLDGNRGGAPELFVPSPILQIRGMRSEPFHEPD